MIYRFEDYALDGERRELRRGPDLIAVEPQVFDLLQYLIVNRGRVVSKDDLIAAVWRGRIVSESALTTRINAVRRVLNDSGEQQRLIRTIPRKGVRFIGEVLQQVPAANFPTNGSAPHQDSNAAACPSAVEAIGPERRQLTIMICEPAGLPSLSARLDPEDLSKIMAECHRCMTEIVERHGGVARFQTAGIVAYFGYPHAHENDAERAIRAGLELITAIADLKLGHPINPLQARVAIATGLVVVGDLIGLGAGGPEVAGETPHLARSLLRIANAGTVLISDGTRRLTGGLFEYLDGGPLELEGITKPIRVFSVLRESAIGSRFEALRSRRTELIGRDEELELLQRRWNQVQQSGEGRVVLIWGEPGIGKSRLAAEMQDAVRGAPHVCLRFYCSPHRAQTALYPLANYLERAASFESSDNDEAKLNKLERLFSHSSQDVAGDAALFAGLLALPSEGRYPASLLSPQRRKELVLERFIAQLAILAARHPVLMLLEDAHWIDPTTRELFDVVIERVRSLPVLLILTYRPEFTPPWIGQSHVTTLTLNRLGRRDNVAMINLLAGDKVIQPALLEQIVIRTDGVPLFIEEMTRSVLESSHLAQEDGASVLAAELVAIDVPETLQGSLVARLDRLGLARAVVQTGAALGHEFTYAVLKSVTGARDADLAPLLDQIVASGLVHQRGVAPQATYLFKHALVQDAAYGTLLKHQRRQLHQRITSVLEQEFPETARRHPDILAYHCTEAGHWEKAVDYRLKAVRTALDRSAGMEAQAQVEKASGLLKEITDKSSRRQLEGRVQVALGDALVMTKGFASPDVAATFSRARDLLDTTVHPFDSLRVLCGLFNYHLMRSEAPKGLNLAQPFVGRRLDRMTATVVHYLVGAAHLPMGNFAEAQFHLEKSLSLSEEKAQDPIAFIAGYHVHSFTLVWLGLTRLYLGSIERARTTILAAVEDARNRSHPFTLVSALLALARFLNHTGDLHGAIAATEEGYTVAEEQRSPYHLTRAGVLRAVNAIEGDRLEQGIKLMPPDGCQLSEFL